MSDDSQRERGRATFAAVMQFPAPDLQGEPFYDATLDHLFADVWARPGLSLRERRLITLTVLVMGGNEMALRLHFGAAMRSGDLSDAEIDELLLHLAHYAGWPAAAVATQVVRELRSQR